MVKMKTNQVLYVDETDKSQIEKKEGGKKVCGCVYMSTHVYFDMLQRHTRAMN